MVAIKVSARALTIASIVAVLVGALVVSFNLSSRMSLDNSMDMVGKMLNARYEIQNKQAGDSLTDLSGVWSIRSKNDLTEELATRTEFAKADDDDLRYFKQLVVDAFGSGEMLEGYVLYRAKFALGEGTICSTIPCSIYVLVKTGSSLDYIGIYKT